MEVDFREREGDSEGDDGLQDGLLGSRLIGWGL